MRDLVLGDHHQSARVPIETMNDTGTQWSADRRQTVGPVQESVDQRTGRVTRGRVHDQARRFINDEEELILEYDRNRNRFRFDGDIGRWRNSDLQLISGARPVALSYRMSAKQHSSIIYERRYPGSAQVQPVGKKGVEPGL
jgi:hypothetical protein